MSPHLLLHHYGYFGVAIMLILEFLFIPFPAETILIFSGVMWHQGELQLLPLLLVATLSSWTGSLIAYGLGGIIGRPLLLRFGRYIRLDEPKLQKAEFAFRKYSIMILGLGRFIAGVRVLIAYVAGMNKMGVGLYMIITVVSAALWSSVFIFVGASIGLAWRQFHQWLFHHPLFSISSGLVLAVLLAAVWRFKHNKIASLDKLITEQESQ